MHIVCVICSDLFLPSSDLYATPCGHLFHYKCLIHWFENSKTCPQCRMKVSSKTLVRLFVNIPVSRGEDEDITTLQHKLDSIEFNMKLKDKDIENIRSKNEVTMKQNKALRAQVKELELAENRYESVIAACKDQIKFFKDRAEKTRELKAQKIKLEEDLKDMQCALQAVVGSKHEVEEMIRNETNKNSLALMVVTLKKSLVDTEKKRKVLQSDVGRLQNELSVTKRKLSEITCEYTEMKRQLETLRENHQKETSFLKGKLLDLQAKRDKYKSNETLNNSIKRIVSESPVNYNRTPVLSKTSDFVDLSESPSQLENDCAPVINEDSPLPASSMGLFGIERTKARLNNANCSKFSIFKNTQPAPTDSTTTKPKSLDVSFDGFGGSSKEDIFPTPQGVKRPKSSKMTSAKFKKLSAGAGKISREIT